MSKLPTKHTILEKAGQNKEIKRIYYSSVEDKASVAKSINKQSNSSLPKDQELPSV
jgi:hypothetical protein